MKRVPEELARSVDELKALGEISQAVSSTLDLEKVLTNIVRHAVKLSKTDAGTIYEFDEAEQVFVPRINYGASAEFIEALRESKLRVGDKTVIGQAAIKRAPDQVPDLVEGARLSPFIRSERRLSSHTCIAAAARRPTHWWTDRPAQSSRRILAPIVDMLQTFAAQSVVAIHNARLFQEIEEKRHELEIANQAKASFWPT